MEENLKKTFGTINELADNFAEGERKSVKLGMELQKLKSDYYFKRIAKCVIGDLTDTYGVFEKLKPLYDEFGYAKVNRFIIEIADEKDLAEEQEAKEEVKEDE